MTLRARKQQNGLVAELQRTHRGLLAGLVAMLVVSLGSSGYMLLDTAPRVRHYSDMSRHVRLVHEATLDQETGLRGWAATADEAFLTPYDEGRVRAEDLMPDIVAGANGSPQLTAAVVETMLARQTWQSWAQNWVGTGTVTTLTDTQLTARLNEGRKLFEVYRDANERSTALVVAERDAALDGQQRGLVVTLVAYLLVIAAAATIAVRRRRQVARTIATPVAAMLLALEELRAGDLDAQIPVTDIAELDAVGTALTGLTADLRAAGALAHEREERLTLMTARLRTVVRIAREVSGSVSVRYVSEAIASAAADLLQAPTTVWVRDAEHGFHATCRSDDPHGTVPPSDLPLPEVVLASAADARLTSDATSRAYPLVLAGMVVGVLQVAATVVDPDTEDALEALLSTAAAALESARLHKATRELADHDALTQLPNRRRMDAELATEWERARRYARPLSFLMIDLDHFKRLNDEHGHLVGDAVLHEVAQEISRSLRSTDTAYRYGGEEIAVLLRETDLDGAAELAERLRETIAGVRLDDDDVRVTASFGVAERTSDVREVADLVAAADAALYTAKRTGRDRVVLHDAAALRPVGVPTPRR